MAFPLCCWVEKNKKSGTTKNRILNISNSLREESYGKRCIFGRRRSEYDQVMQLNSKSMFINPPNINSK